MLERAISSFFSKFFRLALPKNFVGEPFCFHKLSGIDKFYGKEGGKGGRREYQDFPSKFFCH